MEEIQVAELVSSSMDMLLICPYCAQENRVITDPGADYDGLECWCCNRISFLDSICRETHTLHDDEPVLEDVAILSVEGVPPGI